MGDPFIGPTTTPSVHLPPQWQTDRQDLQAACLAMLNLFVGSYADYIRAVYTERPLTTVGEGPFVYVGKIVEVTLQDQGIRQTSFHGVFGYVDVLVEPRETSDRVNVFADFMRELLTYNARMLAPGIFYVDGLDDAPEVKQGISIWQTDVQLTWHWVIQRGEQIYQP